MMRLLLAGVLGLALSACAAIPDSAEEAAMRERPQQPQMHASLVRGMLQKGQNHAALAHIEELERVGQSNPDELRWLRALALYKLDQLADSKLEYQALLKTEYAAQAYHGLGLIAARHDLRQAVIYFNQAVKLRPTDAEIRNDLGYTLLLAGRMLEARHHLATAAELAPDSTKAQSNLVLSYIVDGQEQRAQAFAGSFGFEASQWRQLQAESRMIKSLILERASEFVAEAKPQEEPKDEAKQDEPKRRTLPGLYQRDR